MSAWNRLTLRGKILSIIAALVLITVGGGLIMIWYTYQMETVLASIIETDFATFRVAKGLETALLNQRGFVSYYLLEDDPEWLKELGKYRQQFEEQLKEARAIDRSKVHRELLDQIEEEYQHYITEKDKVIGLYRSGDKEEGAALHHDVREHFFKVLDLCDKHIQIHNEKLDQEFANGRVRAARLRLLAGASISIAVVIGGLLSFFLVVHVLEPIRKLTAEADRRGDSDGSTDEMTTLRDRVHGLIEDVDHTHAELEQSQKKLMQSERMAVVGKLAAEVAHSVRNPLTSIKMRLFSLDRTLQLTPEQRDDLNVISDEIRQLDNIVQNFLEFSRPPKLKMQIVNISEILDMALQLLEKRIERHNVEVIREKRRRLPGVEGDPELLKEVFVNLIVNACEAMQNGGGRLIVKEEEAVAEHLGRVLLIQVEDTGPGVPEEIRDKIMEPFFSTKEDGTGLGLAIAGRIVDEHGGTLGLRSQKGKGAAFTITLPVKEEES